MIAELKKPVIALKLLSFRTAKLFMKYEEGMREIAWDSISPLLRVELTTMIRNGRIHIIVNKIQTRY